MARKILILTPQTPFPPDQGAPIRNYQFIRHLGEKNHLALLTFARPDETGQAQNEARTELERYCRQIEIVPTPPPRSKINRVKAMVTNRQPDLALRLQSEIYLERLRLIRQEFRPEVVICEGLELAPYVFQVFENERPLLVLDEHNAEYRLQERAYQSDRQSGPKRWPLAAYSFVQARRLAKYEARALSFFNRVIAVSPEDREALSRLLPSGTKKAAVIPNGIDLQEFYPAVNKAEKPDTLVFTGSMDFRPNVDAVCWFARQIWPLIRKVKPEARFYIVGRRPAPEVQALGDLPGITVTGAVADTRPYVWESALYVVPMRMGGGVRFKVLEALAMGKAVLSTTMGADGISLVAGRDAELADKPEDFAMSTLRLLDDAQRRAELGRNGREFVAAKYDWQAITPLLDEVIT